MTPILAAASSSSGWRGPVKGAPVFRMIVAYRAAGRAVFLYGFAKSDRDNIDDDELEALRTIGANWLAASTELVGQAIEDGDLKEIEHDEDEA